MGKYLELKQYAETSKTCLGTAKSVKYLTMSDLTGAISEKVGSSVANDVEDETNIEKPGEHIVVYLGWKWNSCMVSGYCWASLKELCVGYSSKTKQ